MNIMMKTKDVEDDYTLELFYSHSLILCNSKREHDKAQFMFPKIMTFFATWEKNVEGMLPQL